MEYDGNDKENSLNTSDIDELFEETCFYVFFNNNNTDISKILNISKLFRKSVVKGDLLNIETKKLYNQFKKPINDVKTR